MMKGTGNLITFGDRLAHARKKRGLLQSQLAKLIGIDRTTLSDWETGRSFPKPSIRVSVIQKMVETLEVSEDWLMGNDDSSNLDNLTENTKSMKLTKEQQQLALCSRNSPVNITSIVILMLTFMAMLQLLCVGPLKITKKYLKRRVLLFLTLLILTS